MQVSMHGCNVQCPTGPRMTPHAASHGVYGVRRVFSDLREAGESCGLHRVDRLIQRYKIKAVRGYKKPRAIAGLQPLRPTICSASSRSMLPSRSG